MVESGEGITRRTGLQVSLAAGLAAGLTAGLPGAAAASSDVGAVIDAAKTGEPISKFIYGAFSERIQGFIYSAPTDPGRRRRRRTSGRC